MENESLLLLYYQHQRKRASARRRSLVRRRRRLFLALRGINQNIMYFQYVRTITLAIMAIARIVSQINQRQFWEIPRPRLGWFEVIFGDERQSGYWKQHFRMRKETFLRLVDFVTPEIAKENTVFRVAIPPHKRVAIALWRLAVGSSFRAIAAHFDVGKSTCVTITKEFCQALNRLSRHYIKFPVRCDETTRALAVFQDDCRFPQAVGAIDGTHIEIIAPEEPFDYFDRHHRYSVILQAVVGQNLTFLDTAIGYPGSMHDARVLRSSDIFQKAQDGEILTEPLARINGVQVRPLLLGDGAYPLLPLVNEALP
ncbi:protein ALP1-like [Dendronephthya gigantea]|uniref:protein ALP1-like n=1 Tax=Dendronephthya gigantea TaxID=151771 RepID=UPI00106BDDC1|nr:protein ALP1-like [Dendronephthya gigantea]